MLFILEVKHAALGTLKIVVTIGCLAARKQFWQARHHFHADLDIVAHLEAASVERPLKVLLDAHAFHVIEVDVVWNAHRHALDEHGGVLERDIQPAQEAEGLWRKRHKTQHGTTLVVDHDRVVEVELVEIHGDARQRADEAVGQQGDVVLENVDLAHVVVEQLLDVGLVDMFVDAGTAAAHDELLVGVGVVGEMVARHGLLDRERQHALARQQRRVGILVNPPLFLGFAGKGFQVAEAHHHALILAVAVVWHAARITVVAAGTQLLDHINGRIILLAVVLLALSHNHLAQFNSRGYQVHEHHVTLPVLDVHDLGAVAHRRDT